MADLNNTLVRGNLRVTSDSYLSDTTINNGELVVETNNTWLTPSKVQLGRRDANNYSIACIGVTDGNLHIDAYQGKDIYLNYYQGSPASSSNKVWIGSTYYIRGDGYFNGSCSYASSAGSATDSTKLPLTGGDMTGSPYITMPASPASLSDSQPFGITYGRVQSYDTIKIAADTDGTTTEYVILTAGYGLSNATSANGLAIGYDSLTWKNNNIIHAGNIGSQSVNYATSSGSAGHSSTTDYVDLIGSSPDNAYVGGKLSGFYSWNQGSPSGSYCTGITISSHPSDPNYGWQLVQPLWNDNLYVRRYDNGDGGWKSWNRLALASEIPTNNNQLTNGAGYITSSALADYVPSWDGPGYSSISTSFVGGVSSGPLTGSWDFLYRAEHRNGRDDGPNYICEIASSLISDGDLCWRKKYGSSFTNFRTIIDSSNIGSQSVNYANSTGYVAWSNVDGRPTNVSSFNNDSGYITNALVSASVSGNTLTLTPASGSAVAFTPSTGSVITDINNAISLTQLTSLKIDGVAYNIAPSVTEGSGNNTGRAYLGAGVDIGETYNKGYLTVWLGGLTASDRCYTTYEPEQITRRYGSLAANKQTYKLPDIGGGHTATLGTKVYKHHLIIRISQTNYAYDYYNNSNASTTVAELNAMIGDCILPAVSTNSSDKFIQIVGYLNNSAQENFIYTYNGSLEDYGTSGYTVGSIVSETITAIN